jgi:hypothetical protein
VWPSRGVTAAVDLSLGLIVERRNGDDPLTACPGACMSWRAAAAMPAHAALWFAEYARFGRSSPGSRQWTASLLCVLSLLAGSPGEGGEENVLLVGRQGVP